MERARLVFLPNGLLAGVGVPGLDPGNLLRVKQALFQLSYTPSPGQMY